MISISLISVGSCQALPVFSEEVVIGKSDEVLDSVESHFLCSRTVFALVGSFVILANII